MINKKTLIVVLGMHRSGTSALTRALKVVGVDLGDNLMQPIAKINEKGFFEDLDINKFNDYLLNKMDSIWCSPQIPQTNQLEILNNPTDINTAIDLLNSKINNVAIFGFKDPRVTVLLPFWQNIFKICNLNVNYLIAIRNPLSVAKSLEKRDRFSVQKGLFLWAQYMLASLEYTNQQNRVLVSYEQLMLNPNLQLQKISEAFNLPINDQELKIFTNEFLDSSLQHTNLDLDDLKILNYKSIYNLYVYFLELLNNNIPSINLEEIKNNYINDISLYLSDFNHQDFLMKKINELLADINFLKNNLESLNKDFQSVNKDLDELHQTIKSNATHIRLIENNLTEMENSLSWKITQPFRYLRNLFIK